VRSRPEPGAAARLTGMLPSGGQIGSSAGDGHWLTAERVRVYSWMIVVIFAAVCVFWVGSSLPALVDPRGKPVGADFIEFWSAARLALAGTPAAAYDWHAIGAVQHTLMPTMLPGSVFAWPYPPIFLLPVVPLGLLPYPVALAVFVLGTAALWACFVRRLLPERGAWIVAAAAPAGLINMLGGQNAFLTASLAGFALLLLARRPVASGVLIGLLAIKPHLAVLFPLALLAAGEWRAIAAAAVTVVVLAAASLAAFGIDPWLAFFEQLPVYQGLANVGGVPWSQMPSPYICALSLGAPAGAAAALQGAVALFAAGGVWWSWRNPAAPFEAKAATLMAGSLLVSPYLFAYDLTWAAAAVGWLALLALRTGFRPGEREILLLAWLAPGLMPLMYLLTSVQLGFPAVLLLLVAAVRRAATTPRLAGAALAPPPQIAGSR
jgi:glycosyl transferase family 87